MILNPASAAASFYHDDLRADKLITLSFAASSPCRSASPSCWRGSWPLLALQAPVSGHYNILGTDLGSLHLRRRDAYVMEPSNVALVVYWLAELCILLITELCCSRTPG